MTLRDYLILITKHRYLLIAGLVLGGAAGAFSITSTDRSFRGEVSFFITSAGEGTVSAANAGDQFATRRVNSYLALLDTERLGQMILDDTGLDLSLREVRRKVSGTGDLNTVLLNVRVDDADEARALVIAESLARTFPELVSAVEQPAVGDPTVRLDLVSGPSVRETAIRTRWILATRMLAGLVLAAAIASVRELTDNRLQSVDRALALSKAPLLGLITSDRRTAASPLILDDALGSTRAEEYRQLRTNLQFVDDDHRARVIVVTSSVPGEGKSVTAANLAVAMARSGQRVAIVDADLRKPTIGHLFGVEQGAGLVDVLRGRVSIDDVLQDWGAFKLSVLPAGGTTSIPSELLGTVATARLIAGLRSSHDTVIIDSPPLVPVTDAAILATIADGVVLLARPDKVTKAQFQRSLGDLERVHSNLLGIVCTMTPERSNPYGRGYGYGNIHIDADAEVDDSQELRPAVVRTADRDGNSGRSLLEDALKSSRQGRR